MIIEALFLLVWQAAAQLCLFPNGGVAHGYGFCNMTYSASNRTMCCPYGWSCTNADLCVTTDNNQPTYIYGACGYSTDLCPRFCHFSDNDPKLNDNPNSFGVSICDQSATDASVCCNYNGTLCNCNKDTNFNVGPLSEYYKVPSPTASAPPGPTANTSTRNQLPSESSGDEGLSSGAQIGIGVGAGVGGAMALFLAGFFALRVYKRGSGKFAYIPAQQDGTSAPSDNLESIHEKRGFPETEGMWMEDGEAQVQDVRGELSGAPSRVELSGALSPRELPG